MNEKKKKLARIAYERLIKHGVEQVSLAALIEETGLPADYVRRQYADGDDELRMDAIAYAGERWMEQIRQNIRGMTAATEALGWLIEQYALGSREYPGALTAYVDLWKQARDGNDYVRRRLAAVYRGYMRTFVELAADPLGVKAAPEVLGNAAQLLTVLSDLLHLQSHILHIPVDFDAMGKLLRRTISAAVMEVTA